MSPSFSELAESFRVLLFDAYGVLKEQSGLYPGVGELLERLERPWWIVSNDASRTPEQIAEGYPAAVTPSRIVTSGLVLRRHLQARGWGGRLLAYLGPPTCAGYFTELGLEVVAFPELSAEQEAELAAVAVMDEDGFDWRRELTRLVNLVRARSSIELFNPNPDRLFPSRDGAVGLGAGALTALLESALGRAVPSFGKPSPEIFSLALERAREAIPDLRPEQVLMIGDTLATDIAGAQAAGLRAALVLSGNETRQTWEANAAHLGLRPDWVLDSILT